MCGMQQGSARHVQQRQCEVCRGQCEGCRGNARQAWEMRGMRGQCEACGGNARHVGALQGIRGQCEACKGIARYTGAVRGIRDLGEKHEMRSGVMHKENSLQHTHQSHVEPQMQEGHLHLHFSCVSLLLDAYSRPRDPPHITNSCVLLVVPANADEDIAASTTIGSHVELLIQSLFQIRWFYCRRHRTLQNNCRHQLQSTAIFSSPHWRSTACTYSITLRMAAQAKK